MIYADADAADDDDVDVDVDDDDDLDNEWCVMVGWMMMEAG